MIMGDIFTSLIDNTKVEKMTNTILVIDDEKGIVKMLIRRLKKVGYEIITASNGKEVVEQTNQI